MAGMAVASTIISVVSAAAQAANNYQNYKAQAQAASANAQVAENNARNVAMQGSYAQDAKLQEGKQYISNQYVRNLVSGAGGAGTTGDRAVAKSAYNLARDINFLDYNYATKATDYLNQSKMYNYENKVAKANAVNSLIGGGIGVANSVLASKTLKRDDFRDNNNIVPSAMAVEFSRPSYAQNVGMPGTKNYFRASKLLL